jgi:hypothetical protein
LKASNAFISPGDLKTFEEGVFTNEQFLGETSRQDAFLKQSLILISLKPCHQPDNNVIAIQDAKNQLGPQKNLEFLKHSVLLKQLFLTYNTLI